MKRTGQQNKAEEWRDIVGFEGIYKVSNFGRVKSLVHLKEMPANIRTASYSYFSKEKLLTVLPRKMSKNLSYGQVNLYYRGKQRCVHVHRLVAQAFIPNPFKKPQVNHKDGDGLNNIRENLEWVTVSENSLHAFNVLGRKPWHAGKRGFAPVMRPIVQKTKDGKVVKYWATISEAVRRAGFEGGCITRTCQGENKSHRGFIWEYV